MRNASRHPFLAAAAAAAAFAFSAPVLAQTSECESNSDCSEGLICAVVGSWGACSAPACPEGGDCDVEPVCEEGEIRECVEPPCAVDADCGAGLTCVVPDDGSLAWCEPSPCTVDADCGDEALKCFEDTWRECTGSAEPTADACPPGSDCPEPEAVEITEDCTTYTERFCAPKYVGPCETADDCGEGFDCVPAESCWCTGSGGGEDMPIPRSGTGGASSEDRPDTSSGVGGAPAEDDTVEPSTGATDSGGDVPAEPTCGCEPTGTNYCELQELPCETDAACPEGWSCVSGPTAVVDCDPGGPEEDCVQPEPEPDHCEPPEWGGWVTLGGSDDSDSPGAGGEVTTDPRPAEDGDKVDDLDEGEGGAANDDEEPADDDEDDGADDVAAGNAADAEDDSGCQVAMGSRAGGSALGLLLGLVGLGALRRRR